MLFFFVTVKDLWLVRVGCWSENQDSQRVVAILGEKRKREREKRRKRTIMKICQLTMVSLLSFTQKLAYKRVKKNKSLGR